MQLTTGSWATKLAGVAVFVASMSSIAQDGEFAVTSETLRPKLERAMPHLGGLSVARSTDSEFYEVIVKRDSVLFYVTADGSYLFTGDLYRLDDTGPPSNISERRREVWRSEILSEINRNELVTYAAHGVRRRVLYAFVDVGCVFSREFHSALNEITGAGVEVHYLAFPREGVDSTASAEMASAWCSDDPPRAVSALMDGKPVPRVTCGSHPVQRHYDLGIKLGVDATPTMFTAHGMRLSGFRDAEALLGALGDPVPPPERLSPK